MICKSSQRCSIKSGRTFSSRRAPPAYVLKAIKSAESAVLWRTRRGDWGAEFQGGVAEAVDFGLALDFVYRDPLRHRVVMRDFRVPRTHGLDGQWEMVWEIDLKPPPNGKEERRREAMERYGALESWHNWGAVWQRLLTTVHAFKDHALSDYSFVLVEFKRQRQITGMATRPGRSSCVFAPEDQRLHRCNGCGGLAVCFAAIDYLTDAAWWKRFMVGHGSQADFQRYAKRTLGVLECLKAKRDRECTEGALKRVGA